MYNPWEEFLKKTIFLTVLGFLISTTDIFHETMKLFVENKKVVEDTRSEYEKIRTSVKVESSKAEIKTSSR
jgi:hypothetical protein